MQTNPNFGQLLARSVLHECVITSLCRPLFPDKAAIGRHARRTRRASDPSHQSPIVLLVIGLVLLGAAVPKVAQNIDAKQEHGDNHNRVARQAQHQKKRGHHKVNHGLCGAVLV